MRSHAIRTGIVAAVVGAALWGGSGIASAGGGCMHSTGPTTGRGDTVEVSDMCFTATVLYVERGTDVTWTNLDPMEHDVVGVGGTWGNPDLALLQGDNVSYRFDEDGVFPYACWIHPGMIGAIVVGDGVGSGLAGVVPGTKADAGSAASTQDVSTRGVGDGNVDPSVLWIAAAGLMAAGLAGGFAIAIASRRRKGAVAG
jgi:plastocyanin